ncbi:MAG: hypothetical protein AAF533_03705 [Acidobacteriota bacterium]
MLPYILVGILVYFGLALLVARACALNGRLEAQMAGPDGTREALRRTLPVAPVSLEVVELVEAQVPDSSELTIA